MENSNKYAWTWKVKEEYLDEYVKMHMDPWPEIMEEHRKAGFKNYFSIFQNGNQFFYCFECDNPEAAFAYTDKSEVLPAVERYRLENGRRLVRFQRGDTRLRLKEVFYLK